MHKRLGPLEGEPGRAVYADGAARIELSAETITVRPPFGLAHARVREVELGPSSGLDEDHLVAALLVRLGGYAVGVLGRAVSGLEGRDALRQGKHRRAVRPRTASAGAVTSRRAR